MKKVIMMAVFVVFLVWINLFPAAVEKFHPNWLPAQSKWVLHIDQSSLCPDQAP